MMEKAKDGRYMEDGDKAEGVPHRCGQMMMYLFLGVALLSERIPAWTLT
jgi:hypothetical protein